METKQSSSKIESSDSIKSDILRFKFQNMIKKHSKSFALIIKMLLKADLNKRG